MKILITGAMGTGKTTLTSDISKNIGYKILPEVARLMAEEGYKLDKKITPEIELEILRRQVLLEEEKEDYIADRGLIDLLAYCLVLFPEEEDLLNKINIALSNACYDIVFYLPIEFPIEEDGVRSTDVVFQKKIDEKIKFILSVNKFNYYKIKGSRLSRINQVFKKI